MRTLSGPSLLLALSVLGLACGGPGPGVADVATTQRQVEWWPVPWRGGVVDVALVAPDPGAAPAPHPVIIALPWGGGSVGEVMEMLFAYWIDQAPPRGYYVLSPRIRSSSLAQNDDVVPAIFDWIDGKLDYDPSRVALVGASNGGRGVFFGALDHPERFGALLGMPGRYEGDGSDLHKLAGIPILLLVGEFDDGWLQASEDTRALLEAHGVEATLEVLAGQGHILVPDMGAVMDWIGGSLGL